MSSDEKKPLHPEAFKKGKEEKIDEKKSQKVSKTFKALADPTRLKILTALSKQELCVHDLSKLLKMSQSAISHQLTVLKNAKIVKFRKKGRRIFYTLDDKHVKKLLQTGIEHTEEKR